MSEEIRALRILADVEIEKIPPIHPRSSVVELSYARKILAYAGFGLLRKDEDTLEVYTIEDEEGERVQKRFSSLYIDEGVFNDTLTDTGLEFYNAWYMELVDFSNLLSILTHRLCPDFDLHSGGFIGRGRTKQHNIPQYVKALSEAGLRLMEEKDEFWKNLNEE
jgi:hypothetical protein